VDIWSDFVDHTDLCTDLEDQTERLSSLKKFMKIRSQTEVWCKLHLRPKFGLKTKSDLFYQVTHTHYLTMSDATDHIL